MVAVKKLAVSGRDPISVGSFVRHEKLLDLGSGEIVASHEGTVRIRFASGERSFVWDRVVANLTVTQEAPVMPAPAAAKPKASKKAKAAGTTK